MSAIAGHPGPVEVGQSGRTVQPPPAAPGAAHHPGCRLAPGPAGAQGRRGGAGRAPARTLRGVQATGARTVTSSPARPAAQRPALAAGVPRPGPHRHLEPHAPPPGVPHDRHAHIHLVIVGAGLAGAKAAETLRAEGFDGRLLLLGEEAERPYERPPLSKAYLRGEADRDSLYVHPEGFYAAHNIELRPSIPVGAIDPGSRQLEPVSGERISYERLLLATGAAPRRPPCPGRSRTVSGTCAPGVIPTAWRPPPAPSGSWWWDRLDRQRGRRLPPPARPGGHPGRPGYRTAGPGARPGGRRRLPRPARRPRRAAAARHPGRRPARQRAGRGCRYRGRAHHRLRPGADRGRRRSPDRAGRGGRPARPQRGAGQRAAGSGRSSRSVCRR